MSENKCEKLRFHHAWEEITPNIIYPTHPPQYPPKTERCRNCGLIRKFIIEKKEYWLYEKEKEDGGE